MGAHGRIDIRCGEKVRYYTFMGVPVRFDYVEVVLKLHKAGGGVGWNPTDLETVYFGAQTTR